MTVESDCEADVKFHSLSKWWPGPLRRFVLRRSLDVSSTLPSQLHFKIAQSRGELDSCFKLFREANQNKELKDMPHLPTLHHALPTTTHIIAKWEDEVIAVVSIIKDCELGFPLDKYIDTSFMRNRGQNNAEIMNLIIHEDFKHIFIKHYMVGFFKYLYQYCVKEAGIRRVFIRTNNQRAEYYRHIFLAKELPLMRVVNPLERKSKGVGLYIDFSDDLEKRFFETYAHYPANKNIHQILFSPQIYEGHFIFPIRKYFKSIDPVFDAFSLKKYFFDKGEVFSKLSLGEQDYLLMMYNQRKFTKVNFKNEIIIRDHYRFSNALQGKSAKGIDVTLKELSRGGFKIPHNTCISVDKKKTISFIIEVGPSKTAEILARPVWCTKLEAGYEILKSSPEWDDYISYLEKDLCNNLPFEKEIFGNAS